MTGQTINPQVQDTQFATMLLRLKRETLWKIRQESNDAGLPPDGYVRSILEGAVSASATPRKTRKAR